MSAESRDVADVLAEHEAEDSIPGWVDVPACTCGWRPDVPASLDNLSRQQHVAHVADVLAPLIEQARAEAWPCANYRAPATCLTAPSSESGRCDWCKGVADQIRAQALRDAADWLREYDGDTTALKIALGMVTGLLRARADQIEAAE